MKKIITIILIFVGLNAFSQTDSDIPESYLLDIHGHRINTKDLHNHGKPFVITFWASWQKSSLLELNNLHEVFKIWNKESGFKVFAISIDYPETYEDVRKYATHHKWEFDIYIDEHSHFEKLFNVSGIPHTMLFDGNQHLVWQRHSYSSGDEEELHEELLKLVKKE